MGGLWERETPGVNEMWWERSVGARGREGEIGKGRERLELLSIRWMV